MLFLDIIHAIIGILFALFIPGYLLTILLFNDLEILERISLAIGLSMCVDILIGLLLGGNKTLMGFTGGITAFNLWIFIGAICVILLALILIKNKFRWESLILR